MPSDYYRAEYGPFRRSSTSDQFPVLSYIKDIVFDDSEGNNNGAPDYGERIRLKITVRNLGQGASSGLSADISVLSGQVTVENSIGVIGTLAPGASYTINTLHLQRLR